MQYLAIEINEKVKSNTLFEVSSFQSILSSLQSRLLQLNDELDTPTEQLICITMLVFLTLFFALPGRRIPLGWVARQVPQLYAKGAETAFERDSVLHAWVVTTLTISVTNLWAAHVKSGWAEWSKDAWGRVTIDDDWPAFKSTLMRVVWIESLLDEPAERTFKRMKGGKPLSTN